MAVAVAVAVAAAAAVPLPLLPFCLFSRYCFCPLIVAWHPDLTCLPDGVHAPATDRTKLVGHTGVFFSFV